MLRAMKTNRNSGRMAAKEADISMETIKCHQQFDALSDRAHREMSVPRCRAEMAGAHQIDHMIEGKITGVRNEN